MTDEDREREIIEKRVEESKEKPLTREDLIRRFGGLT
jgi:chorismate mutase